MNDIELSFCIPTYNRAQSVHRLVTDILACQDSKIEVVVLDNGSTDDTLSILRAIKDERLSVYSNGENKGALYNMVHVLNKGRGQYLVYSTDQDYVDHNKINEFKSFLMQQSGLACGFCTFSSMSTIEYELFPKGFQSIKNIAYKGRHPTGYFFNNKLLKSIQLVERFSDYDFVDLFPLEFAFAELCLLGSGAIYHGPIFTPETGTNVVTHKSSTTSGKSKKAFFLPEARLKLAINYATHINTLQLTQHEKKLLICDTFINGLTAATIGYKSVIGNNSMCIHYSMDRRDVDIKELLGIGCSFYKRYVKKLKNNYFKSLLEFDTKVIFLLIRKILLKMWKISKLNLFGSYSP